MQRLSYSSLCKIQEDLSRRLIGQYINNVSLINSRDFVISFSKNKGDKLLISLNHNTPFITFCNIEDCNPTISGQTNDYLRRRFKEGRVEDIKILNEDRVLEFTISKPNDYYERELHYLILEIIPTRSNLIILDEDRKIEYALHYSSLTSSNAVIKGMKYESLSKGKPFNEEKPIDLEELRNQAKIYLVTSKENRLKERYDYLFKYIKSRLKSLKSKIIILNSEIEKATSNLVYKDYATTILSLINDEESLKQYVEENFILIDESLPIGQNANNLFKKYKKAKRTIEMDKAELTKTYKEIEKLEVALSQIKYMNDDDLYELAKELLPHKFQKRIKESKKASKISYVLYKNTKIFFGKNSKQNDDLTFRFAKKEHYFFHIKDYHGAHIILESDKTDNELFLLAAEISLILSNKLAGDVYYTKVKNVKKSDIEGKVNMLSYSTITLNSIREETYDLLLNHH